MTDQNFKAGFVNIIGYPNVGKSTLMNALLREKLSIVTPKKQTTRHRILGMLNGSDYQIVFSDTPGIIQPKYLMHESMMRAVNQALEDGDVLLYMVESNDPVQKHKDYLEKITQKATPLLIVINKVDLSEQDKVKELINQYNHLTNEDNIIPISATNAFNTDALLQRILELLPQNPAFFPEDQLTDKSERFIVSEVIREKAFFQYKEELPYSLQVNILQFEEEAKMIHVDAEIVANRKSQKHIIIGKNGEALKKVGTKARKELEEFFGKKVYLEVYVKIREGWRENATYLNEYGYDV